MAIVPLSADDCDRAAHALRDRSNLFYTDAMAATHQADSILFLEAEACSQLAQRFATAAAHDRAPPTPRGTIPDRIELG